MEATPEQSAEGLAVVRVLAAVLDRLVGANAPMSRADPGQVTKFHALKVPAIGIMPYLERIHKYASCSTECYILALIYIDRLIQRNSFLLTELNVHRVVITAILLGAKFFDDSYYNNAYYAKVGGVLVSEMNGLEVDFLFRINFSLHVTPEMFHKYRHELLIHTSTSTTLEGQQVIGGCDTVAAGIISRQDMIAAPPTTAATAIEPSPQVAAVQTAAAVVQAVGAVAAAPPLFSTNGVAATNARSDFSQQQRYVPSTTNTNNQMMPSFLSATATHPHELHHHQQQHHHAQHITPSPPHETTAQAAILLAQVPSDVYEDASLNILDWTSQQKQHQQQQHMMVTATDHLLHQQQRVVVPSPSNLHNEVVVAQQQQQQQQYPIRHQASPGLVMVYPSSGSSNNTTAREHEQHNHHHHQQQCHHLDRMKGGMVDPYMIMENRVYHSEGPVLTHYDVIMNGGGGGEGGRKNPGANVVGYNHHHHHQFHQASPEEIPVIQHSFGGNQMLAGAGM